MFKVETSMDEAEVSESCKPQMLKLALKIPLLHGMAFESLHSRMSLIPEFVEPQKSSAGKLSLVQYESGQQEGEGRAAKTPKKKKDIIFILFYYYCFLINIITNEIFVY